MTYKAMQIKNALTIHGRLPGNVYVETDGDTVTVTRDAGATLTHDDRHMFANSLVLACNKHATPVTFAVLINPVTQRQGKKHVTIAHTVSVCLSHC